MPDVSKKVISFGPPKEAALYFDQVLPFDMAIGVIATVPAFSKRFRPASVNSIPVHENSFDAKIVENLIGMKNGTELYKNMRVHR